ncbi:hypothetical protein Tco_0410268 [Tanacetum coccineum]
MVEPKKPLKKKDQIMFDKEVAQKLQAQSYAELEEEEKLARQREEDANIAKWDNSRRSEKKTTNSGSKKNYNVYLSEKHGWIQAQSIEDQNLEDIQMLFDKEMKRVNTFVDMDTELVKVSETRTEGSSKRAREELESKNLKKQKLDENVDAEIDDDQEEAEMKKHMEIVPDDEVAIDVIPLATKPPIIVD